MEKWRAPLLLTQLRLLVTMRLRAAAVGGPFELLGPWYGNNGVQTYFRLDLKRHPADGALLCLTVGQQV